MVCFGCTLLFGNDEREQIHCKYTSYGHHPMLLVYSVKGSLSIVSYFPCFESVCDLLVICGEERMFANLMFVVMLSLLQHARFFLV